MRGRLVALIVLISVAMAMADARGGSVSGSVLDDSGAVVPGAFVEIQLLPEFARDSSGHLVSTEAAVSVTAQVDSSGSYSAGGLPAGRYLLCAYSTTPGYISNCQWTTPVAVADIASNGNVTAPLQLAAGTVVQIVVADPQGLIGAPGVRAVRSAVHYFYPGVMRADGYFAAARLVAQSGPQRTYAVTIPKSATVYLFVDSDLQVSTGAGQSVPVRTPSGVAVAGGQPVATVSLAVGP
jgi:hypothetical protein